MLIRTYQYANAQQKCHRCIHDCTPLCTVQIPPWKATNAEKKRTQAGPLISQTEVYLACRAYFPHVHRSVHYPQHEDAASLSQNRCGTFVYLSILVKRQPQCQHAFTAAILHKKAIRIALIAHRSPCMFLLFPEVSTLWCLSL